MSRWFAELARATTPMGDAVLRRRLEPTLEIDVFEVMLGGEGLMSSLFTAGEEALARLGLAATTGDELDVLVAGLGLGHTAHAALQDPRVRSLHVVDALAAVIEWHRQGLTPLGPELTNDPRCTLVHGDFFALVDQGRLVPGGESPDRFDVILVDIDHSPVDRLDDGHAGFYEPDGLRRLADQLRPGGVFALWSNDAPDDAFLATLRAVFARAEAPVVSFPNFLIDGQSHSTIYVAISGDEPAPARYGGDDADLPRYVTEPRSTTTSSETTTTRRRSSHSPAAPAATPVTWGTSPVSARRAG